MAVAGAPAELTAKIAKNLVLNPLTNAVGLRLCVHTKYSIAMYNVQFLL